MISALPILIGLGAVTLLLSGRKKGTASIDAPSRGGAAPIPRSTDRIDAIGKGKLKVPGGARSPGIPQAPRGNDGLVDTAPPTPPTELLAKIAEVLASQNVAAMRELANELEARGFPLHADDLRKAADVIEDAAKAKVSPPKVKRPKNPPPPVAIPQPSPVLPELPVISRPIEPDPIEVIDTDPFDPDPRRALALKVQRHMATHPGQSYDQNLIKTWQAQEGCEPDGLYGYCSGIAFLKYNLAPPKPRVKLKPQRAKDWRNNLLFQAKKDPARAAEYTAAAQLDQ